MKYVNAMSIRNTNNQAISWLKAGESVSKIKRKQWLKAENNGR